MRRLVEDDITDRLRSQQVRTRRRRPIVQELTGRMPRSRIAESLAELEHRFDPQFDSTAALDELRQDPDGVPGAVRGPGAPDRRAAGHVHAPGRRGRAAARPDGRHRAAEEHRRVHPGHLPGRPRSATRPGLVVTIYQWSRPRDLAHYESFGYDHATFGLRVEGLTTTPFSDRALDRGLTGVLVTRCGTPGSRRCRTSRRTRCRCPGRSPPRCSTRSARGPKSSPTTRERASLGPGRAAAPAGPVVRAAAGRADRAPRLQGGAGRQRAAARSRRGIVGPVVRADEPCARSRRRSCCSSTGTTAASATRRPGATTVRPLEVPHDHPAAAASAFRRVRCWAAQCSHPDRAGPAEPSRHHRRGRRHRRPAVDERDRARPGRVEPRAPGPGRRAATAGGGAAGARAAGPGAAARAVGPGRQRRPAARVPACR